MRKRRKRKKTMYVLSSGYMVFKAANATVDNEGA